MCTYYIYIYIYITYVSLSLSLHLSISPSLRLSAARPAWDTRSIPRGQPGAFGRWPPGHRQAQSERPTPIGTGPLYTIIFSNYGNHDLRNKSLHLRKLRGRNIHINIYQTTAFARRGRVRIDSSRE